MQWEGESPEGQEWRSSSRALPSGPAFLAVLLCALRPSPPFQSHVGWASPRPETGSFKIFFVFLFFPTQSLSGDTKGSIFTLPA